MGKYLIGDIVRVNKSFEPHDGFGPVKVSMAVMSASKVLGVPLAKEQGMNLDNSHNTVGVVRVMAR